MLEIKGVKFEEKSDSIRILMAPGAFFVAALPQIDLEKFYL